MWPCRKILQSQANAHYKFGMQVLHDNVSSAMQRQHCQPNKNHTFECQTFYRNQLFWHNKHTKRRNVLEHTGMQTQWHPHFSALICTFALIYFRSHFVIAISAVSIMTQVGRKQLFITTDRQIAKSYVNPKWVASQNISIHFPNPSATPIRVPHPPLIWSSLLSFPPFPQPSLPLYPWPPPTINPPPALPICPLLSGALI